MQRPVLVVGDVQGDDERLAEALAPYAEDDYETVFLGDFFQGGELGKGGGYGAAVRARKRRNSRVVIGNHDVFILVVLAVSRGTLDQSVLPRLRSGDVESWWLNRRGDPADLEALAADPALEAWLRDLPLIIRLDDGTIAQHTDDAAYLRYGDSIDAINSAASADLAGDEGLPRVLLHIIGRHAFDDASALDGYLATLGGTRLIHGHTPHWQQEPYARHHGRIIGYDGSFSRFWARGDDAGHGPAEATVALLPPLPTQPG